VPAARSGSALTSVGTFGERRQVQGNRVQLSSGFPMIPRRGRGDGDGLRERDESRGRQRERARQGRYRASARSRHRKGPPQAKRTRTLLAPWSHRWLAARRADRQTGWLSEIPFSGTRPSRRSAPPLSGAT
jgi:hypothetical protein